MKFNFCNIPVIVARKARMNIFIERIFSFLLSLSSFLSFLSRSSGAYIKLRNLEACNSVSTRFDLIFCRFGSRRLLFRVSASSRRVAIFAIVQQRWLLREE